MGALRLTAYLLVLLLPLQAAADIWPFGRTFDHEAGPGDIASGLLDSRAGTYADIEVSLCSILSDAGCAALGETIGAKIRHFDTLEEADVRILIELLSIGSSDIDAAFDRVISDTRRQSIRVAGLSFGSDVGYAVEARRVNRFLENYGPVLEAIRFEDLLLHYDGFSLVPPIIDYHENDRRVGESGRVFRAVSRTYEIREQVRFTTNPPTWQDYLYLEVPEVGLPARSVLPEDDYEFRIWRSAVIEGYLNGLELAGLRSASRTNQMVADWNGMIRYHLLRTLNMITEPLIESRVDQVVGGGRGETVMTVSDRTHSVTTEPVLNPQYRDWRAIGFLNDFDRFHVETRRRLERGVYEQ